MIEITRRCDRAEGVEPHAHLTLPFELRQKSRLRTHVDGGEDAWIVLDRGEILRGGDMLIATDGRFVRVIARPERLLHVDCNTPLVLARVAYHLGNRHVPVEVGEGFLRLAFDHVLERMIAGLGARVSTIDASFEPEAGAYGTHTHHADSAENKSGGRIHEYGSVRGGTR